MGSIVRCFFELVYVPGAIAFAALMGFVGYLVTAWEEVYLTLPRSRGIVLGYCVVTPCASLLLAGLSWLVGALHASFLDFALPRLAQHLHSAAWAAAVLMMVACAVELAIFPRRLPRKVGPGVEEGDGESWARPAATRGCMALLAAVGAACAATGPFGFALLLAAGAGASLVGASRARRYLWLLQTGPLQRLLKPDFVVGATVLFGVLVWALRGALHGAPALGDAAPTVVWLVAFCLFAWNSVVSALAVQAAPAYGPAAYWATSSFTLGIPVHLGALAGALTQQGAVTASAAWALAALGGLSLLSLFLDFATRAWDARRLRTAAEQGAREVLRWPGVAHRGVPEALAALTVLGLVLAATARTLSKGGAVLWPPPSTWGAAFLLSACSAVVLTVVGWRQYYVTTELSAEAIHDAWSVARALWRLPGAASVGDITSEVGDNSVDVLRALSVLRQWEMADVIERNGRWYLTTRGRMVTRGCS